MKSLAPLMVIFTVLFLTGCASTPAPSSSSAPAKTSKNLALGKTATENNHILDFSVEKAFDGDTASYWEGAANSYPNVVTVDLEKKVALKSITLRLNPRKIWTARTQTIEVSVSDDGSAFRTVVPQADYEFSPLEGGNAVTIDLPTSARYIRLTFTANTEATAGQLAELEVTGE